MDNEIGLRLLKSKADYYEEKAKFYRELTKLAIERNRKEKLRRGY